MTDDPEGEPATGDDRPEPGEVRTYTRTFTTDEVQQFAELSKDQGYHHLVEGGGGPVMVHGLLTATMPTKVGGDMDYVAREMTFEFPRPVHTGETVTCEVTVEDVTDGEGRTELAASYVCTNEDDEVVLRGDTEGVIFG
jgi:3-hydroxybutyryl-CoA dehydratase